MQEAYDLYLRLRARTGRDKKPICLMDLATIGAKYLKQTGKLKDLDESDEINACSVRIQVDNGGKEEDWLLLFKNETHNHPTEIEPFGGAATCIGGAIRDPLANRGYVLSRPCASPARAIPWLPVRGDAARQAAPAQAGDHRRRTATPATATRSAWPPVRWTSSTTRAMWPSGWRSARSWARCPRPTSAGRSPAPGDVVILLGGRTGRDGCGGATGSSKAHKLESLERCGAEVQKGNAPEERKLQRLFRDPRKPPLLD